MGGVGELAKQLGAARKAKNLSQKELSDLCGVPQSHISNIENGKVNIRVSSLIEMARILELEPMLVPQRYVQAVIGFMDAKYYEKNFQPAFRLDDEDEHD